MISIIIPTLNEARCIGNTLMHLTSSSDDFEVIVVDGGSTDATARICQEYPDVQFIQLQNAQRACQMNTGAAKATGDTLLFLHADTLPPENFEQLILDALIKSNVIGGAFSLKFDARHWLLAIIEGLTHLNITWLTFGDHGIFLRRTDFIKLNGFSDMPILEDLDLQLRMKKRGRLVRPKASVHTSARRFINNGVVKQTLQDFWILSGYFLGVSPERLVRQYSNTHKKAR